jgi:hypothetical protein
VVDPFADDTVLGRAPGVLSRRLLDGVLVLGPQMSEPVRISAPGDVLWEMLREPRAFAHIVDAWSSTFRVPEATARADVEPVLRTWYDGGALTVTVQPAETPDRP